MGDEEKAEFRADVTPSRVTVARPSSSLEAATHACRRPLSTFMYSVCTPSMEQDEGLKNYRKTVRISLFSLDLVTSCSPKSSDSLQGRQQTTLRTAPALRIVSPRNHHRAQNPYWCGSFLIFMYIYVAAQSTHAQMYRYPDKRGQWILVYKPKYNTRVPR